MSAAPTLLALAAGVGSRFGGPKQLEPLGPHGETILDYALHDALAAGFERAVLVIRAELRDAFERGLAARWRARMPVTFVEQAADPARGMPWGTGHAVLTAADALPGSFAVVNADDFYGRDAYDTVAAFLRRVHDDEPTYAVVGFPLGDTLTDAGGVSRAVIESGADGLLTRVEEVRGIVRGAGGDGVLGLRTIPRDTLVSMGMWGFTRAVLPQLDEGFRAFRHARAADAPPEFFLPSLVESMVSHGRARVQVLRGAGPWIGMTYPADRPDVVRALADLVRHGAYPSPMWA